MDGSHISRNQPSRPAASSEPAGQLWNTSAYASNGRFVAHLAGAVMDLLAAKPGEHILDLGCGDGALTEDLVATGAYVTGLDASAPMVDAARARGLTVLHQNAVGMTFDRHFDAVFSNAALHWIAEPDQPAALAAIFRAIRPGGRFVAEMGGQGNIAAIRAALSAVLGAYGIDAEASAASFFPSPGRYYQLLEGAGFKVHSIDLYPRPTALPGGETGLERWLATFRSGVLNQLPAAERQEAIAKVTRLLRPILSDHTGQWTADYVRLRFLAVRPS